MSNLEKPKDSYGTVIEIGDHVRESISYVYPIGHECYPDGYTSITDDYVGVVEYEKGCHVLNFKPLNNGRLGSYCFHERWPFTIKMDDDRGGCIFKSLWQVVK